MTTYIELVQYFEGLPAVVTGLRQATVGSDEEELSIQTNRIQYPHLRVDTPEISFLNDDESPVTRYTFKIAVMTNVSVQTYPNENAALSDMEILIRRIYQRIIADADTTKAFWLPYGEKKSAPIRRWSGDNAFGWMMDIVIDLYTATCT